MKLVLGDYMKFTTWLSDGEGMTLLIGEYVYFLVGFFWWT